MSSTIRSKEYLRRVYSAVYSTAANNSFSVTQLPDTAYEDCFTNLVKFS